MSRPALLEFHDLEIARLFHEEDMAYHVIEFAKGPTTVEKAASAADVSLSTMRRWVKRFLDVGLIRLVGVNPQRHYLYELAAQKIIIHDDQAPPDTHEDFMRTLGPRWERFVNAAVKGYNRQQELDPWVLVIQSKGENWAEAVPMPRSEARGQEARPAQFYNHWLTPVLTARAAAVVAADLEALYQKITKLAASTESEQGSTYVVHLGFVQDSK